MTREDEAELDAYFAPGFNFMGPMDANLDYQA